MQSVGGSSIILWEHTHTDVVCGLAGCRQSDCMNSSHFCNQLYRRVKAREQGLEGRSRQRMTDRVLCVSVLNTQGSRLLRVVLTETKIDGAKQILLFRSCRRVSRESENYTETNVRWLSVRLL